MSVVRRIASLFQRRDVIGFVVAFSLGGAIGGFFLLPEVWGPWMRTLAGAAIGFNGSLYVIGPRMIGGDDYE